VLQALRARYTVIAGQQMMLRVILPAAADGVAALAPASAHEVRPAFLDHRARRWPRRCAVEAAEQARLSCPRARALQAG